MSHPDAHPTPIHHEESHELLGYVVFESGVWQARTIFGYPIARTDSSAEATSVVREKGLSFLMGVWSYYDKQSLAWYPCVLQEVTEQRVTVVRTNEMGYQDPDNYKRVVLQRPDESVLIKNY